jgi:hypothetical protein
MNPRTRLANFLAWKGWSQSDLACACDVHQTTVSKLIEGHRGAGLGLAVAIERVTQEWPEGAILAKDWVGAHDQSVATTEPTREVA